jgi:hypothetical protein
MIAPERNKFRRPSESASFFIFFSLRRVKLNY